MSNLSDLLEANDERPVRSYATVSTMIVDILAVKHGLNSKTNLNFTAFEFEVQEVLDQKLPRPEGTRAQGDPMFDQDEIEVGEQQSCYTDYKFLGNKNMVTDCIAVLAGIKAGVPVGNRADCFKDEAALAVFEESFPASKKDDKDAYFAGTRVILDVTANETKGVANGYTSYTMRPVV